MIRIFNRISNLDKKLTELKAKNVISDYRIYLSLNNEIRVIVKQCNKKEQELCKAIGLEEGVCEIYNDEQIEDNAFFLNEIFKEGSSTINLNSTRRRMTHLFEQPQRIEKSVPVITFYSYKGGVGRSTAMASCAAYLANHFSKKIVILDCDFEAPGFTNFFLKAPDSPINNEGLVEYLIDEQTENDLVLSKYYWQASKSFSGNGDIYIFPAGNLDDSEELDGPFKSHREHYLNGLTRIDMFSPDALSNQFKKLFSQIKKTINPDLILIDSRTGFNDIFGLSVYRLSDAVVGFFGNNAQSIPGLNFFLDILTADTAPRLIVVNSIIPLTYRRDRIKNFREYVDGYLERISSPLESSGNDIQYSVDTFFVSSNEILGNVGTREEDYRDFVDLIVNKSFSDYNQLFDRINELIEELIRFEVREDAQLSSNDSQNTNTSFSVKKGGNGTFVYKETILKNLKINMPQLYADNIPSYKDEHDKNRYFYRACMEDLFNPTKFLIIGNKGTGKTYIYRSLKEVDIVNELKKRANKVGDFLFVQAVCTDRRFDTLKLDNDNLNTLDYERFWVVYIWNTIMQEKPYGYLSRIETFPILDSTYTKDKFLSIIKNEMLMKAIEEDYIALDRYLSEKKEKNIVVLFDELDSIVNPEKWSERVAPLINLCKKMSYRTISLKLFVRSDLYERTININNKNELQNRSISIEWNREELFAFFFKHLFSHSESEFFEIMKRNEFPPKEYVSRLRRQMKKNNNQIPIDPYVLKQLCCVFFGEYAAAGNNPRFGESYNWFFRNLQNANGTLSLRPFLDLISISVEQALEEDKSDSPILSPYYYTMGKNRAKAVDHHLGDLEAESGNEDLKPIIDYIRDHAAKRFKKDKLFQQDFFSLLDSIIKDVNLQNNHDRDSIINFLEINGIISQSHVRFTGHVNKQYSFALLYKYYLGLKTIKMNK